MPWAPPQGEDRAGFSVLVQGHRWHLVSPYCWHSPGPQGARCGWHLILRLSPPW